MMFITQYVLPSGRPATTQCYARDEAHLVEIMDRRRMDEVSAGAFAHPPPTMASQHLASGKIGAASHALTWIAMIATRSGVARAWDLLNDEGLVHEVAHLVESAELSPCSCWRCTDRRMDLARKLEAFERSIPGVHPCWGGDDRALVPAPEPDRRPLGIFSLPTDVEIFIDGKKVGATRMNPAAVADRASSDMADALAFTLEVEFGGGRSVGKRLASDQATAAAPDLLSSELLRDRLKELMRQALRKPGGLPQISSIVDPRA
jgi:hypothetical protein